MFKGREKFEIDNELLHEINCIVFSLKGKHYLYDYFAFPE